MNMAELCEYRESYKKAFLFESSVVTDFGSLSTADVAVVTRVALIIGSVIGIGRYRDISRTYLTVFR